MVKRQIKNFELVTDSGRYPCTVPCSVGSVLSAAGAELDGCSEVRLECEVAVDDVALSIKHFYLRISGLTSPARIYVGNKLVLEADGITPVYHINAAGLFLKGSNILSIRFAVGADFDILTTGLYSAVEMLRFSTAMIKELRFSQEHGEGGVRLNLDVDLLGSADSVRAVATLTSPVGQMYFSGLNKGTGCIVINDPLYWWPSGQGVQNLYRLTVNLYGESDIEDSAELTIGLRTVKAKGGNILLNGLEIIPMGAIYIPECDPDISVRYRRAELYVRSAVKSNYNCLVVPLGAPTPTERFYQLCDEGGIMVIEEHFLSDLASGRTVAGMLHRSTHPSLCHIDLIDPSEKFADLHGLSESIPNLSFRRLHASPEYIGLPSLPSMRTICEVVPEDERSLFSYSIESIAEPGAIRDMLLSVADRYPYPSDLSGFGYASAMASAHKVGDAIKNSRLSYGSSGRAVFNRLGDPRMAISASAIDSRGRWKPLQYYSARHFMPIALYADLEGGRVIFSASSQRKIDCIGSLVYRIADAHNRTVYTESVDCRILPMTSSEIHSADIGEYIKGHEREYYLEYYVKEGSAALSRKTLLFVPEKHFAFVKPNIKAVITGENRNFSLTLATDSFVKDMEIGFTGVDTVFDDNYFDITSEAPVKVNFTVMSGMETTYLLKDNLELRSVVDLIK